MAMSVGDGASAWRSVEGTSICEWMARRGGKEQLVVCEKCCNFAGGFARVVLLVRVHA